MKKTVLFIAALALLSCGVVKAQDEFATGKFNVELQATPNINGGNWFSLKNLNLGYALGNGDKLVIGLNLNTNSFNNRPTLIEPVSTDYATTDGYNDAVDDYNHALDDFDKGGYGTFGLTLGYNHYFVKEGRVRPYVGGALGFSTMWAHQHVFSNAYYYDASFAKVWYTQEGEYAGSCTDSYGIHYRGFGFGIQAAAGVDFFFCKGLYIGAELGLGYTWTFAKDYTSTFTTTDQRETVKEVVRSYDVKDNTGACASFITPKLRLGWTF